MAQPFAVGAFFPVRSRRKACCRTSISQGSSAQAFAINLLIVSPLVESTPNTGRIATEKDNVATRRNDKRPRTSKNGWSSIRKRAGCSDLH